MCYSKEVQLATGATILSLCLFYYTLYSAKYRAIPKKWLMPFLKNVIIAFTLIGGHQIFEFLSLVTGNQIIYKIGLIISISSMYFFVRSLEVVLNRDLKSKWVWVIIGAVAINIALTPMTFEAAGFHLQHNNAGWWAIAWSFLFIYFHICVLMGRKLLRDDSSKRAIILYLFATLDISFILSIAYALWGYAKFSNDFAGQAPSIWCTFFVMQLLVLPLFLSALPRILEAPNDKTIQTIKETILYFVASAIILGLLVASGPFIGSLSLKLVFT